MKILLQVALLQVTVLSQAQSSGKQSAQIDNQAGITFVNRENWKQLIMDNVS